MDENPYPHPSNPGPLTGDVPQQFQQHEERSQKRYEMLSEQLKQTQFKGKNMGSENVSEKTIVNVDGGGRGGSDGMAAAMIAALGNRNQGNDNASLIAALGSRNNDGLGGGALAALLANRDRDNGLDSLWPLLLLLGRRGGFGGGDDCNGERVSPAEAAILQNIANGITGLTASVPTTALETQNAFQQAIAQLALGTQQGFANVKDAVQNVGATQLVATAGVKDAVQTSFAILNQNILDQGCKGREATQASTTAILQKLDQNEIDRLRHERDSALRTVDINTLRSQVEVNQTVNQTQAQGQGQFQVQNDIRELTGLIRSFIGTTQVMLARQAQDINNFGTMVASGTQANSNLQAG